MNKTIYLVYNGEVREIEVLKECEKSYLLDYNYVKTTLRKVELDKMLDRSISPSYDAVFSFDKHKAIQLYNDHIQYHADKLLSSKIKEEK